MAFPKERAQFELQVLQSRTFLEGLRLMAYNYAAFSGSSTTTPSEPLFTRLGGTRLFMTYIHIKRLFPPS